MSETRPIASIAIGERVRKDMGDLRGLADSIERHGLLHPVVVMADGLLVAGQRRIEAMKLLGWTEAPVTVVSVEDLLSAERDENEARKDFTPSEAVAIGRLVEDEHRARIESARPAQLKAAGLASAARRGHEQSTVLLKEKAVAALGNTVNVASKAVGMSPSTYQRARDVVAAAESDPERFGDLPQQMDDTGNVSGTHRELLRRKGSEDVRHPVHRKAHRRNQTAELERVSWQLQAAAGVLKSIDREAVDEARRSELIAALEESRAAIASAIRRLK